MRKITFYFIICLFIIPIFAFAAEAHEVILHVSPTGDDGASGSESSPLRTLAGAAAKVGQLEKNGDIHVIFHEGNYEFTDSVLLDSGKAGSKNCKIYYEAAVGERVVFTGAKTLDTSKFQLVTDENILNRMHKEVRGKVLQLDLRAQGIKDIKGCNFKRQANVVSDEYVSLFLNGKKEMMSQWPNGENNFTTFSDVLGTNLFRFTDAQPLRWEKADQAYVSGFMGFDWTYERAGIHKIDMDEKTIELEKTMLFGLNSACAKRWQVFNLLEEIDVPGEWFIDLKTMLLYYYPHGEINEKNTLELSLMDKPFVVFEGGGSFFTTFQGITFTQSRGSCIDGSGQNITFSDCTFSYIDANAVNLSGINNTFENSRFLYIGGYAFNILNYGQIYNADQYYIIRNNYFTRCGLYETTSLAAITASSHHLVIEGNTFHNQYGGVAALGWDTCEASVRYNEAYNCERELSDCGVFYCGNTYGDPGNEFAYNLIYDYKTKSKHLPEAVVMGIYMDDIYSGAYIHHNILADSGYGGIQIGGGQNNRVEDNIILRMAKLPIATDHRGETWSSFNASKFSQQASTRLGQANFAKKYPFLIDGINHTLQPIHDVFKNNISDQKIEIDSRMEELGTVKNNVFLSDLSAFVNPGQYDFRIKSGSKLASLCPNGIQEDNFSMDSIGVCSEVCTSIKKSGSQFHKLSPLNKETNVNAAKVLLTWENADMADEYRVVIATDPQMTQIVKEITADYNFCDVGDILKSGNKTYYWTVEAVNKSIKLRDRWQSADDVFSFTTSQYDILDQSLFDLKLKTAELLLSKVTAETYYADAIQSVQEAIAETKEYMVLPDDKIENTQSKNIINNLDGKISTLEKSRILTEENLSGNAFSSEAWEIPEMVTVNAEKDSIHFQAPQSEPSVYLKEFPKDNVLLTFDLKIEYNPDNNGWLGLEMKRVDPKTDVWSDKGYLIVIKKNQMEMQKYPGGLIDTLIADTFADGEYHKVNLGLIKEIGYYKFVFKVDDQPIFEYKDYSPLTYEGYLNFRMPIGGAFSIRAHESDEKTQSNSNIWHDKLYHKTFYTGGPSYTEKGTWQESGTGEKAMKMSTELAASAQYQFAAGEGTYQIYYWKNVSDTGDPNGRITMKLDYVSGREGDEANVVKNIDYSGGENGWVYLGSYKNVMNGITLTATHETAGKEQFTSAVRIVRVENEYLSLAALMDQDESAVVLKQGSPKIISGQRAILTDDSPVVTDGVTMVSDRFAAKVLGADVKEENETVTLRCSEKEISLATGDGCKIVDGKLYLPLRKICEYFDKRVFWDDGGLMIISDKEIDNTIKVTDLYKLFN